jgi:hypothetical protein
MTRETYFSPGTAPLERFARGVYGALPKSLEEANQMFNPVEVLQEASGKSRRFFESGGKDRQAGIDALIDTAMLGVGPAAYGVASLLRTPAKKSVDYATKAFQELFNPLGASDDRVVDTGKKGMTRRDFLGGTGAAMALAGAPILKEAGDLLPTGKIAKASTKELLGSAKTLNDSLKNIKEQLNILKNEQLKKTEKPLSEDDVLRTTFDQDGKPLGKETDVTSEGFQISPDDMLIDLDELFSQFKDTPEMLKLKSQREEILKKYNDFLTSFKEGLTKEKLMQLSDQELSDLNKMKHFSQHGDAGEPLRKKIKKTAEGETIVENAEVDELIDEVLKERDLYNPFFMFEEVEKPLVNFSEGGVVSLRDEARDMFRKPRGIASLTV